MPKAIREIKRQTALLLRVEQLLRRKSLSMHEAIALSIYQHQLQCEHLNASGINSIAWQVSVMEG